MKRSVFCLLAMVAVASLAMSCGGGGDDDGGDGGPYNFAGKWAWQGEVTASNISGISVGDEMADVMTVVQNGTNIVVTFIPESGITPKFTGTCDPDAKTFNASGKITISGITIQMGLTGAGIDSDSMSGTFSLTHKNFIASGTWTADLSSRTLSASHGSADARGVVALVRMLAR